jgi:hypothetical protein
MDRRTGDKMTPDELDFLSEHAPKTPLDEDRKQDEHNWELLREAKKEFYFDDDDLAEDIQRERDRQDIISLGRYG